MERNCDNCKYRDVWYMASPCDECNFEYQRQPQKGFQNWESDAMTNADRIRAMTDEELADELLEWFACFMEVEWSRDMILDWLKEEVKGESDD